LTEKEHKMGDSPREQRIMELPEGYIPEIGRWIWAVEDARGRTREALAGLPPSALDWTGPRSPNSIGSILYHIAAIEADYLYADLLQVEFPAEVVALFPYEVREENGRLTPVQGFDLDWYISRLGDHIGESGSSVVQLPKSDKRQKSAAG